MTIQPLYKKLDEVNSWLDEPDTGTGLLRCANAAIEALHNDFTLRVPRSGDLRSHRFASWRDAWRDKLSAQMQDGFAREFSGIASRLKPDTIRQIVSEHVWPQVERELLGYAVEGLALAWARRRLGDAITLGYPEFDGSHWMVPLAIAGRSAAVGRITLDADGNIIESESSARNEILATLNG